MAQWVKSPPSVQAKWVWSLGQEYPWSRKWQLTPVFLPGKSHGQRSLVGYSPWVTKEFNKTSDLKTTTIPIPVGSLGLVFIINTQNGGIPRNAVWVLVPKCYSDITIPRPRIAPKRISVAKRTMRCVAVSKAWWVFWITIGAMFNGKVLSHRLKGIT